MASNKSSARPASSVSGDDLDDLTDDSYSSATSDDDIVENSNHGVPSLTGTSSTSTNAHSSGGSSFPSKISHNKLNDSLSHASNPTVSSMTHSAHKVSSSSHSTVYGTNGGVSPSIHQNGDEHHDSSSKSSKYGHKDKSVSSKSNKSAKRSSSSRSKSSKNSVNAVVKTVEQDVLTPKEGASSLSIDDQSNPSSARSAAYDGASVTSSSTPPPLSLSSASIGLLTMNDSSNGSVSFDDRSQWIARIQSEYPLVRDVRERVRPLARTLAFARSFIVKPHYPAGDILTGQIPAVKRSESEIALGLVMQHLHAVGLQKAVSAIHHELDRLAGNDSIHSSSRRYFLSDSHGNLDENGESDFDSLEDSLEDSELGNNNNSIANSGSTSAATNNSSRSIQSQTPDQTFLTSSSAATTTPSTALPLTDPSSAAISNPRTSQISPLRSKRANSNPNDIKDSNNSNEQSYDDNDDDSGYLSYSNYTFVSIPMGSRLEAIGESGEFGEFGTPSQISHLETAIHQQHGGPGSNYQQLSSSPMNGSGFVRSNSSLALQDLNSPFSGSSPNPPGSSGMDLSSNILQKHKNPMEDFKRRNAILGLKMTLTRDESGGLFYRDQSFFENDRSESRLLTILRSAVKRAHEVWEMAVADKPDLSPDPIDSILEDKLYRLGLLEDDPEILDDIDIWEEGPDPEEDLSNPSGRGHSAPSSNVQTPNNYNSSPPSSPTTDSSNLPSGNKIPESGSSKSGDFSKGENPSSPKSDSSANNNAHDPSNSPSSPGDLLFKTGSGFKSIAEAANKPPDPSRKLVLDFFVEVEDEEDRPIRSATLNKLVEIATGSKLTDLNFLSIFLLTYRSFTTPRRLLEKLKQRFNVPFWIAEQRGLSIEEWRETIVVPIRLRVISFVKRWLTDYIEDIDKALLPEMRRFVEAMAIADPSLKQHATSIMTTLDRRSAVLVSTSTNTNGRGGPVAFSTFQYAGISAYARFSPYGIASNQLLAFSGTFKKSTVSPGVSPAPKIPKAIFDPNLTLYHIDQEEVARQLTILDSHVFISINPSELLNQSWNKPKLKHQAPNVLRTVAMFNQLSHAISYQILQGTKPKDRAKIIEWWIKVAEHCKALNNFHGLMAIISGINSGPITRLRHSRKEVSKALLDQLTAYELIFESEGSFSAYRSHLQNCLPPVIPYLGIHLTDLVFIEEGNKDTHGHLINFAKRRLLWGVISALQTFQQTAYNLQPVRQIHDLIANLRTMDSRELFKLSLVREPREK